MNVCNTTDPACDQNLCDSVFERVVVSWQQAGGTTVYWELRPDFYDAGPYTFQLQVGDTGLGQAVDWINVGSTVVDTFSKQDDEQRSFGIVRYAHYRVKLVTTVGTYYSTPVRFDGALDAESRRLLGYLYRQEQIKFRRNMNAQLGLLLKRRISGKPCPRCINPETGDTMDQQCDVCLGTRYQCGYYYPLGCVWAKLNPQSSEIDVDEKVRGAYAEVVVSGSMLMIPMITSYDVWVNLRTDDRYYLHDVKHTKEVRGVAVLGDVEFRLAPTTDIIYSLVIPQQVAYAELLGEE